MREGRDRIVSANQAALKQDHVARRVDCGDQLLDRGNSSHANVGHACALQRNEPQILQRREVLDPIVRYGSVVERDRLQ